MKTLFLDIFSGISGDMFIGAMIDLGVDPVALEKELTKLNLDGYRLKISRQERGTIAGTKFDVLLTGTESTSAASAPSSTQDHEHEHTHEHEHEHGHGRTFAEIKGMIQQSGLSSWVKEKSVAVFQRVAVAEGSVHGQPPESVHFHEVGAVDSIVDIVGACVALEQLGHPQIQSGPVIEGVGTIQCAHGRFPLPAPATLEIFKARQISVQQCDEPHELVTPTGAAILAEFASSFGPIPSMKIENLGYGLGTRQNHTRPNVLRVLLGEASEQTGESHDWDSDTVTVLETNLDDINAEILGGFVDKALQEGALDVFHIPVQMKKNRPGVLLTVLCGESEADRLTCLMLRETTAFGVRRHRCSRRKLKREVIVVKTSYGEISVKLGKLDGRVIQTAPEFESCAKAARQAGVSLKLVYETALREIPA